MRLLDYMVVAFLISWGSGCLFSLMTVLSCTPKLVWKVLFTPHPHQHSVGFLSFFKIAILTGLRSFCILVLTSIFIIIGGISNFIEQLTIYGPSFKKYPFLTHVLISFDEILLLYSLYILDINSLIVYACFKHFPVFCMLFSLLCRSHLLSCNSDCLL